MHSNTTSTHPAASDEIDLRKLIMTLWASRLLIIIVTLVVLVGAAAYAFLTTPVYETQAQTLPPSASGLSTYNNAHQMTGPAIEALLDKERITSNAIPMLKADEAYKLFMRHAASTSLRQALFEEYYLPQAKKRDTNTEAGREGLWRKFNDVFTVTLPRKAEDNDTMRVTLQGDDPTHITEWVNHYIDMAMARTQKELADNLSNAVHQREASLNEQMQTLRNSAKEQRKNTIARLQEALVLAEAIDLQDPPAAGNLITSYSGDTAYMRGAKALRSELKLLENRKNDDPFIEEVPNIFKQQALLKNIDLSPEHIMVATIDEEARVPERPIKPRKALILALGLVLGGMLGVFTALMRQMFKD